VLKRSWGGEVKNVSVLAAIGVEQDGFRCILAVAEGYKGFSVFVYAILIVPLSEATYDV